MLKNILLSGFDHAATKYLKKTLQNMCLNLTNDEKLILEAKL